MKQPRELPFVFIIGFNKTGTRSLHNFFLKNKFPSVHWDRGRLASSMVINMMSNRKILHGYDTVYKVYSDFMFLNHNIDIQGNAYFRILDRDYPNSFFIYNYRPIERWIESRLNHSFGMGFPIRDASLACHNTSDLHELQNIWKTQRERFEVDVRSYFAGKNNYLEVDIEADDIPKKLKSFINYELDSTHWEHLGKTEFKIHGV